MQKYLPIVLVVMSGYLLGSIHPSYILGKLVKNIDIRQYGSNNSGASNSTIVLGLKYGVITGAVDILKGFAAPIIASKLISSLSLVVCLAGMSSVLGHMFPFYLNFKGGKGLATMLGFSFAVNPWMGVLLCLILVIVAFSTDYIVIGTVSVAISFFIYTLFKFGISYELLFVGIVACLIIYKHKANYVRIANKTETKVSEIFKKK